MALPEVTHHAARLVEPGLEEDRADERLDGIGEDRLLVAAAALGLALRQDQVGTRSMSRHARAASAHQAVVAPREVALAGGGVGLAEDLGDGEPEHAVAEELEPLVVARAGACHRRARWR